MRLRKRRITSSRKWMMLRGSVASGKALCRLGSQSVVWNLLVRRFGQNPNVSSAITLPEDAVERSFAFASVTMSAITAVSESVEVSVGDAARCADRRVDELMWCLDPNGICNEFAVGAASGG